MAFSRIPRLRHFQTQILSNSHKSPSPHSISQKPISISPHSASESGNPGPCSDQIQKTVKKPLHLLFRDAVGLSENPQISETDDDETNDLKKKLRKLEEDVRRLKKKQKPKKKPIEDINAAMNSEISKPKSLLALFSNKEDDNKSENSMVEEPMVLKDLSPDMGLFANHLYEKGYFKDANFLPKNGFDVACFSESYSRNFLKFAAEKFGKDHQEIAQWLSGSDLKKIVLFGCPTLARKNIFSAKKLRTFFRIQEDTVCNKCVLKESCKFPNQSVWKGDTKNLNLAVVMRVITLYALEAVHPKLVVPDDIKAAVSRLLNEILRLSKTIS